MQQDVLLAPFTTIKLGGPARYFWECKDTEEMKAALRWAAAENVRVHVLGGGSNTVFPDEGFDGLIIHIASRGIEFGEDGLVTVQAGEPWDAFVMSCIHKGLSGIECLSGIPGIAGATPIQNVGAYGQEVAQTIVEVRVLDRTTLTEKTLTHDECKFAYRWSRFKGEDLDKYIVTSVVFKLTPNGMPSLAYPQVEDAMLKAGIENPTLSDVRNTVIALRKSKSMVVDPEDPNSVSCGSFFENITLSTKEFAHLKTRARDAGIADEVPFFPKGDDVRVPSAWLIGHAGFKTGLRRDGVGISDRHNLALINAGGTAKALWELASRIQNGVEAKFGVELRPEPIMVKN